MVIGERVAALGQHALKLLGRPLVQDVLFALALAVLGLLALQNPPALDIDFREPDDWAVLLVLAGAASVAVRSVWPVPALFVSLVALVLITVRGYGPIGAGLPSLFTMYAVASRCRFRTALVWGLATVAAVVTALLSGPVAPDAADWLSNALILVTAWSLGRAMRSRRAQLASLIQRDDALATAADAELSARLVRERAEVAREVQDLLAHKLTEITVQAAAARRAVPAQPDLAVQLLADVEASARDATQEMRRLLRLLTDGEHAPDLGPAPGLDDLVDLIRAEASRGVRVALEQDGEPAGLPHGAALAVYRLVEETLTRAREGGWSGAVQVRLDWTPRALDVTLTGDEPAPLDWDDGLGEPGRGLALPGRRLDVYGGRLQWGRGPNGVFQVAASLPIDDGRPS